MTRERRFNCIGDQVFAEIMADDASNTVACRVAQAKQVVVLYRRLRACSFHQKKPRKYARILRRLESRVQANPPAAPEETNES